MRVVAVIIFTMINYLAILGGSLKNTAKKITISVPVNKNTYTSASMFFSPYYKV
jgi:hypothetical protein